MPGLDTVGVAGQVPLCINVFDPGGYPGTGLAIARLTAGIHDRREMEVRSNTDSRVGLLFGSLYLLEFLSQRA